MSFFINNFLINPAVWLWILGIYFTFRLFQGPWHQKVVLGFYFLFLLLTLLPFARILVSQKERQFLPLEKPMKGKYILILGAGSTPDLELSSLQQVGGASLPRIIEGYSQYLRCKDCFLICSGTGRTGYLSQAAIHAEVLLQWGVPAKQIKIISEPNSTVEEALAFIEHFPEVKELVLVTSALHMPRAYEIFEGLGLNAIPAPCNYKVLKHPEGERFGYIPSLRNLELLSSYLHEILGCFQWRYL